MTCPNCFTENDSDAIFCKNCGTNMQGEQIAPQPGNKTMDVLVFVSITYWFAMDIINFAIRMLMNNWYDSPFKYFQIGTNLIYAAIPIIIALSIKTRGLKIPAIIFAAFISCYLLYTNVEWLIRGY